MGERAPLQPDKRAFVEAAMEEYKKFPFNFTSLDQVETLLSSREKTFFSQYGIKADPEDISEARDDEERKKLEEILRLRKIIEISKEIKEEEKAGQ